MSCLLKKRKFNIKINNLTLKHIWEFVNTEWFLRYINWISVYNYSTHLEAGDVGLKLFRWLHFITFVSFRVSALNAEKLNVMTTMQIHPKYKERIFKDITWSYLKDV